MARLAMSDLNQSLLERRYTSQSSGARVSISSTSNFQNSVSEPSRPSKRHNAQDRL